MNRHHLFVASFVGITVAASAWAGDNGHGHGGNPPGIRTTIYVTRHPDDQIQLISTGPGTFAQDCNERACCVERATDLGIERSNGLADGFDQRGITSNLDEVIATHKPRTAQMVYQIAANAGLDVLRTPTSIRRPAMACTTSPPRLRSVVLGV